MSRRLRNNKITKKNQRSLIAHINPKSPITEQYRTIRTSIQFTSVNHDVRIIAVTSASPSEGKSTTAANLSIVLAQQGNEVLLIDGDLRKPTCHSAFELENHKGLTNALLSMGDWKDFIHDSVLPGLSLITSGTIPPNPADLLGTKQMDSFLQEARKKYDYIIIDTPPLLTVVDAQIVSQKSDGVVLVVEGGGTEKAKLLKAKNQLMQANANILGVVLNGMKNKINKRDRDYYGGLD